MQVTVGSTITVENPSQELIQWCSQNLKIRNPDYSKKVRMHFWVGNTPEILSLYEVRGNALVLPFGTLRAIAPMLQGAETFADFSEAAPIDFKCRVPLYDYQQKAVDEVLAKHYGILQSPAGSGKTQMPRLMGCRCSNTLKAVVVSATRANTKSPMIVTSRS